MNSYASNNFTLFENNILSSVFQTLRYFFDVLTRGNHSIFPTFASRLLLCVSLLLSAITVIPVWLKLNISKKLLSGIIVLLLPFSINCMFLIFSKDAIHTLVLYGFVSIYFIFAVIFDNTNLKKALPIITKNFVIISTVFTIIVNIYTANIVYLRMNMEYESLYSFYNSLITQVKMTPGFDSESKIALVGNANSAVYYNSEFDEVETYIAGTAELKPKMYTKELFVKYYLGCDIPFANSEETESIKESDEFKNMSCYPSYGSVQKIDNLIVIKFNE